MTVVIAYKSWRAVAVIADCRISYEPPYEEVDDCLQKLYYIHDRLVMGFTGPLQGAYEIMQLVRENVLNYSRHLAADRLQADVERWIKHKYQELDAQDRKNLSFVIATIEPRREKRSRWYRDKQEIAKPEWFPYVPEWRTLVLRPSDRGSRELVKESRGFVKVVGIGRDDRVAVRQVVEKFYSFASKQPELQMQAVMGAIKFELMSRHVRGVGGLFQSALLHEKGIQWVGYGGGECILELAQGRFVQRNVVTGKALPLMSIWEWAKLRPSPGSLGAFEDPGLQKALENLRRTESEADDSAGP